MKKKVVVLSVLGIGTLAVLVVAGCGLTRFGYESAPYTVIQSDGAFEIRDYEDLTLVSTSMDANNPNDGGSFQRLFKYISKGNEAEEKISMTTPVFMTDGENAEMSFVVPTEVAAEGAPQPTSDKVSVREEAFGKVAAYRYKGGWSSEKRAQAKATLFQWVDQQRLGTKGSAFGAGYDPPFTPPAMRRNEVLVRLAD